MVSLEFDPKVNALYLRLKDGEVSSSEPIAENLIIDFGEEGEVVGIELLLPPKLEEKIKAQITRLVESAATQLAVKTLRPIKAKALQSFSSSLDA